MPIKAIIFDMDGLLINSEPIWREAEKTVFATVGIRLTDEMCFQTVGLRIDEVVEYWYVKYPWKGKSNQQVKEEVIKEVMSLVKQRGEALPGVYKTLEFFKSRNIPMAIGSASPLVIINQVIEKLKIASYFTTIHSAESEEYGKPHPAVYISTARMLNVKPYECLVFEDSFNGIVAARAARMKVIAVPEDIHYGKPHFAAANLVLKTLDDFNETVLHSIP